MYRVAGLKCLTHIYTGFHTSRDKGSLMKLLPLDLRFPKSKLRKIGSSLLHLMWSAYFDDFLCLSRASESRHVEFCASSVFSLLGWKVSTHKLLPFDSICKVLGVQLDLKQSGDSLCLISNTPERVEELVQEINLILSSRVRR